MPNQKNKPHLPSMYSCPLNRLMLHTTAVIVETNPMHAVPNIKTFIALAYTNCLLTKRISQE